MASAPQEPTIKLVSFDGHSFTVPIRIARMSTTIRTMLDDLQNGADVGTTDDDQIPLPNVKGDILERVIRWCTQHKDDPETVEEDEDIRDKRTDNIPEWDASFFANIEQGVLFDIILAANYLDIKGLMDVACKTVANMIKGKTPEQIRQTFNIKNDFTPAEEEQIRRENEWCEEK